jgi:hypothetical protein
VLFSTALQIVSERSRNETEIDYSLRNSGTSHKLQIYSVIKVSVHLMITIQKVTSNVQSSTILTTWLNLTA